MSGRRLLDAIRIFNVTRNVAGKHIALQRHYLDINARTSSLTKGAKAQADRIGSAVKAAADLARKLNDSPPGTAAGSDYAGTGVRESEAGRDGSADLTSSDAGHDKAVVEVRGTMEPVPVEAVETERTATEVAQPLEQIVDKIPLKSPGSSEPVLDAKVSETPSTAQAGETAAAEELPEEMMQQLFRSPKTSSSLFRNRYTAKSGIAGGLSENSSPIPGAPFAQPMVRTPPAPVPVESEPATAPVAPASSLSQGLNQEDLTTTREESLKVSQPKGRLLSVLLTRLSR